MAQQTRPEIIILWVHPRSTSTAFERAFLQRPKDFTVLHEPLGDPWYFGPERVSPRFSPEKCSKSYPQYSDLTFSKRWSEVSNVQSTPRQFVKDMAQYILLPSTHAATAPPLPSFEADGNPTIIPTAQLLAPNIIHTFLIRTPEKAVPSYHKLCSGDHCAITGFDYFDEDEVGIKELRQLYEFISSKQAEGAPPPVLVDSCSFLARPEETMRVYCERVGVDFDPAMLQWSSGEHSHFAKWKGWHTDVETSTGIKKSTEKVAGARAELPKELQDVINANMEDFLWLKERELKV